jgi:hypothetical protein
LGLGADVAARLAELGYPSAIVSLVRSCSNEDELLDVASMLAPDFQEGILELASGGQPAPRMGSEGLFVVADDEALRRALAFPFDEWRVFLHSAQRQIVDHPDDRHLVVAGGPGTGKTVCLIHRAVRLAQNCGSGEAVALVFHSPDMVAEGKRLLQMLVSPIPASLLLTDMIALGRRGRPQPSDIKRSVDSNSLFLMNMRLRALLIDEAQDLHRTTKNWIWAAPLALDPNQNLFAKQDADGRLQQFVAKADHAILDYGYRLSREIAEAAGGFIAEFMPPSQADGEVFEKIRARSAAIRFGFRGPSVRLRCADGPDERAKLLEQRASELASAVGAEHVGLVQFLTQNERAYHPVNQVEMPTPLRTPRSCKGLEFRSGVLFEPKLPEAGHREWPADTGFYVALTRFREEVDIITDCATAQRLASAGVGTLS